ncbi:MAG TPA: patatin-like phospholipase family protein [Pseudonocardia sp.]|uniref:patatin-like phospholipase family protein n=1 Tax=Pseudonocardia sp. TaxID=60912 RepID=UPI002EDA1649
MGTERALVLGGGGLAGIAWQTGILYGLAEAGVEVTGADLVVGTSAGSTVAAQLGSGLPLAELFERQADPARQNEELTPTGMSLEELMLTIAKLLEEVPDPVRRNRRIGELALAAATPPEAARRAVIEARLPKHEWPSWPLSVVAVDVHTGEHVVFDRDSGVELVDAVAASCAVPGVWPPVTIGASRYMDGGARAFTNVDLARAYRRVLVIAPLAEPGFADQLAELTGRVEVVQPDADSLAAFGTEVLDPAVRTPAARAGRAQGRRAAAPISGLWS